MFCFGANYTLLFFLFPTFSCFLYSCLFISLAKDINDYNSLGMASVRAAESLIMVNDQSDECCKLLDNALKNFEQIKKILDGETLSNARIILLKIEREINDIEYEERQKMVFKT